MSHQLFVRYLAAWLAILGIWRSEASASADLIVINNPGFEATVLADGNSSTAAIPNWFKIGPVSLLNPNGTHFSSGQAAEGQNVASLGAAGSILSQDLVGTTLQPGIYTISFAVGNLLGQGFPELDFNLLINATTIIPLMESFTPTVPDGEFRTWSFSYDVTNENVFDSFYGDPLRIRFLVSNSSVGGAAVVDHVQGTFRAVPEPSFAGAILGGVVCYWLMHRRRGG